MLNSCSTSSIVPSRLSNTPKLIVRPRIDRRRIAVVVAVVASFLAPGLRAQTDSQRPELTAEEKRERRLREMRAEERRLEERRAEERRLDRLEEERRILRRREEQRGGESDFDRKEPMLGMTIDAARKSEFFTTKKWEESGRTSGDHGASTIVFAPHNRFDDGHATLSAITNASGRITELQLILDRAFYDGAEYYAHTRMFAADFLTAGLPVEDRPKMKGFLAALNTIRRPADPTAVSPLYSAFVGKKDEADLRLPSSVLRLSNIKTERGDALRIAIALAEPNSQAAANGDQSAETGDEPERPLLGGTYQTASRSAFFETFISQSEVRKNTLRDGGSTAVFEPGEKSAFHGGRTFTMTLDPRGRITAVRLDLDRKFLDASVYAGMTCDLAKSLLLAAAHAEDAAKVKPLAQAIAQGMSGRRGGEEPQTAEGYSVFLGKETESQQDFSTCSLHLRNSTSGAKKLLSIELASFASGTSPEGQNRQ